MIRIATNGHTSCIEIDGKTLGNGVEGFSFVHPDNGSCPEMELKLNVRSFSFMPDGAFDEYEKRMMQESSGHKPSDLAPDD